MWLMRCTKRDKRYSRLRIRSRINFYLFKNAPSSPFYPCWSINKVARRWARKKRTNAAQTGSTEINFNFYPIRYPSTPVTTSIYCYIWYTVRVGIRSLYPFGRNPAVVYPVDLKNKNDEHAMISPSYLGEHCYFSSNYTKRAKLL